MKGLLTSVAAVAVLALVVGLPGLAHAQGAARPSDQSSGPLGSTAPSPSSPPLSSPPPPAPFPVPNAGSGALGCTKDTDCKGDRVCDDGRCVSTGPTRTASTAPSGGPPPVVPDELRAMASKLEKTAHLAELLRDNKLGCDAKIPWHGEITTLATTLQKTCEVGRGSEAAWRRDATWAGSSSSGASCGDLGTAPNHYDSYCGACSEPFDATIAALHADAANLQKMAAATECLAVAEATPSAKVTPKGQQNTIPLQSPPEVANPGPPAATTSATSTSQEAQPRWYLSFDRLFGIGAWNVSESQSGQSSSSSGVSAAVLVGTASPDALPAFVFQTPRVAVEYAVGGHLTIGGSLGFFTGSSNLGSGGNNGGPGLVMYLVEPRVGYLISLSDRWVVWPRMGISVFEYSQSNSTSGGSLSESIGGFALDLEPTLMLRVLPQAGCTATALADVGIGGSLSQSGSSAVNGASTSVTSSNYGVTFGAFLGF